MHHSAVGGGGAVSALRISPQADDQAAVATSSDAIDTVRAIWADLGLSVKSSNVGEAIELQATGEHGEALIFRVSDNVMTLQGESECRPD